MNTGTLSKVTAKTAEEVCKLFDVGDDGKKLLTNSQTPRQFFDLLQAKGLLRNAVRFLAFALPKREAVWWGCQCLRQPLGVPLVAKAATAVQAAEKWTVDPNEDNRWAAKRAADAVGLSTPAGLVAMSAFWSGGSMLAADKPAVPPPQELTPKAVAGALLLAPLLVEPEKAPEKSKKFLALGVEVGNGTNRWGQPAKR